MNKKNYDLHTLAEVSRELDVPAYRIHYLFSKRLLKREDFLRIGSQPVFTSPEVEIIRQALATIKTFKWNSQRREALQAKN